MELPDENPSLTKILPYFKLIFYPIIADFCKCFQRLGGCSPMAPLSPTLMGTDCVIQMLFGSFLARLAIG